jgi:tRNA nucleotidyltransferase/poly(A) polymerase
MSGEMQKTLVTSGREFALRRWSETGLLAVLLPELAAHWPSVGERACELVRVIRADIWTAPLAAMLYPLIVASACNLHSLVADLKQRLKLSNEELAQLKFGLEQQPLLESALDLPWSQVQPQLINPAVNVAMDLLEARVACGEPRAESFHWLQHRLTLPKLQLNPLPLVSGRDLQELGISAGPKFKELLDRVRTAQLDGQLLDRQSALDFLRNQHHG